MSGLPIADAVQAGEGLVQGVIGLINEKKTAEEARRLAATRPKIGIDPLVNQDLSLAESELSSNGSAAERAYNTLNNGQYSSAIDSALKSGANPNSVAAIYGNSLDGRLRLAQMSDQRRLSQISNYLTTSRAKQDANQTQWQVNEFAPWADKAQANAAARAAASQQVNQGMNTFGAGVANGGQAIQERNAYKLPTFNTSGVSNPNSYATGVPVNNSAPAIPNSNYLTPITNFPVYNP